MTAINQPRGSEGTVAYRTILVHLNDPRRVQRLLAVAVPLAEHQAAELIGLHVVPGAAALTAVVVPYGAEIAGATLDSDRKAGEAIAARFAEATAGRSIPVRWLEIETMHPDLCSVVLERARTADLVVAAQSDRDWPVSDLLDFPERLALESGRPVLVVPNGWEQPGLAQTVMVAWSGTRESARAAFDALPLLASAKTVHVVRIADGRSEINGALPPSDVVAALARHGVVATSEEIVANDAEVSELLLARVASFGADLLVMGAYGHARWREYVFGGVTRDLARRMIVPTLLSH